MNARLLAAVLLLTSPSLFAITAREIIARIQTQVGKPMPADTVDRVIAGNPDNQVTGIAVTMMATQDVLERSAEAGANLVITHEPIFWSHRDSTADFESRKDAVYVGKRDFIDAHHLVVWRFHDGWHAWGKDGVLLGQTKALGWTSYQQADELRLFTLPSTTVGELAADISRKLSAPALRVVGDPSLRVTKVALQPGAAGTVRHISLLERDDVEVLAIGEVPEWETIEYVADAARQGRRKALILIGHIPSEQFGMAECARWLPEFIHEVPVKFIPTKEFFWQPGR